MSEVAGWIYQQHLQRFLQHLAAYVDHRWDDLDDLALVGALDATDAERSNGWFEYPITSTPPITVRIARDPGTEVLRVRVAGATDDVLVARISTLLDVL